MEVIKMLILEVSYYYIVNAASIFRTRLYYSNMNINWAIITKCNYYNYRKKT